MAISARYENKRFRIKDTDLGVDRVGEDRNVPFTAGLTYYLYPQGFVSGIMGYNFGGSLSAEDDEGNILDKRPYDPSPMIGIIASFRF